MRGIEKYDNLKEVIPNLMPVLRDAIQSEFLEIKKIDKECEKYIATCEQFPELKKAEYVIFSHHIKKNEHKYEIFVFIDGEGNTVRHITGADMELYGLLGSCSNLHVSEEYIEKERHCIDNECRH
ncbi:MAG: hypothetical protein PHI47_11685 [Sulfuricurvum sp.]|uniref:hypothetical protein n=1 Tax=Sulfuricurvum sp. TaxID=2025608 RepID=UPI0026067408|nr:hypothetical protein [Sulfuricurvum sp.]MDD5160707.1 hypothetical protein [Sulfuricurvum sp.]